MPEKRKCTAADAAAALQQHYASLRVFSVSTTYNNKKEGEKGRRSIEEVLQHSSSFFFFVCVCVLLRDVMTCYEVRVK